MQKIRIQVRKSRMLTMTLCCTTMVVRCMQQSWEAIRHGNEYKKIKKQLLLARHHHLREVA